MSKITAVFVCFVFIFALFTPTAFMTGTISAGDNVASVDESGDVLISEIQTRSEVAASHEFVELYNRSDTPINLSDWRLQYLPATGDNWSPKIRGSQHVEPVYIIEPGQHYLIATEQFSDQYDDLTIHQTLSSGSAEGGGHIRLLRPSTTAVDIWVEVDRVGWGTAEHVYDNTLPAPAPPRGGSIYRCFDGDGQMQTAHDNFADFQVSEQSMPGQGYDCPVADDDNGETENDDDEEQATDESGDSSDENESSGDEDITDSTEQDEAPSESESSNQDEAVVEPLCQGVVISEVLPNPQGPRSEYPREDNAFIELYNITDNEVALEGCGLQTSANSAVFWFETEDSIAAEEYLVLFERDSGVQLPVSPSGTVYLLAEDESEITSTTYPENMPEAAAWAWFGNDTWEITYSPTPGELNQELPLRPCPEEDQERNPETNRCRSVATQTSTLTPCLEGQERNPDTNRCRSIESIQRQLVPCAPHQERNPETNRCRNITQPQRQLVPCEPHQERNPETNRCRNIESASSELGPCPEGQERNPETNRCRTVAQPNSEVMSVQDIKVATHTDSSSWLLSGSFVGAALTYGAWEWRTDVRRLALLLKRKIGEK